MKSGLNSFAYAYLNPNLLTLQAQKDRRAHEQESPHSAKKRQYAILGHRKDMQRNKIIGLEILFLAPSNSQIIKRSYSPILNRRFDGFRYSNQQLNFLEYKFHITSFEVGAKKRFRSKSFCVT